MRRYAIEHGVPAEAIVMDPDGLNTAATATNTRYLLDDLGARRVLAVSHFYHLPRVKLSLQREGITTYTVPAEERYTLTKMPLLIAREVAAWWAYYLRLAGV
jgi:uncharacterized SAM-binding protein YcdF (DUF218 family)